MVGIRAAVVPASCDVRVVHWWVGIVGVGTSAVIIRVWESGVLEWWLVGGIGRLYGWVWFRLGIWSRPLVAAVEVLVGDAVAVEWRE